MSKQKTWERHMRSYERSEMSKKSYKMPEVNHFDFIRDLLVPVQLHPARQVREVLPDMLKAKFAN